MAQTRLSLYAIPVIAKCTGKKNISHEFDSLERVTGIEPVPQPWEGRVLPLYDTRWYLILYFIFPNTYTL